MVDWETLKFAFTITLLGVTIVFLALIALWILMSFFPVLNYKRKKTYNTTEEISDESYYLEIEEDDLHDDELLVDSSDDSLIAVLTAAVMAYMKNSPDIKIKVTSFKRIPQTSSVWNTMGRNEYISNKL